MLTERSKDWGLTNNEDQPLGLGLLRSKAFHSMDNRTREVTVEHRAYEDDVEEQADEQQPADAVVGGLGRAIARNLLH
jgi:hypothetical protein